MPPKKKKQLNPNDPAALRRFTESAEIIEAAAAGDLARVRACVARGADIDKRITRMTMDGPTGTRVEFGDTPLMAACKSGNSVELVRYLAGESGDLNAVSGESDGGCCVIHFAALRSLECLQALLEEGNARRSRMINKARQHKAWPVIDFTTLG